MKSYNLILTLVEEILKLGKDDSSELVDPTNFLIRMIKSLWYLTFTRSDILFGVRLISKFMESPCQSHLQAVKYIIWYIKGTQSDGIFYAYDYKIELVRYIDGIIGDVEKRKNTSSYAFNLALGGFLSNQRNNCIDQESYFSWKKQTLWH